MLHHGYVLTGCFLPSLKEDSNTHASSGRLPGPFGVSLTNSRLGGSSLQYICMCTAPHGPLCEAHLCSVNTYVQMCSVPMSWCRYVRIGRWYLPDIYLCTEVPGHSKIGRYPVVSCKPRSVYTT